MRKLVAGWVAVLLAWSPCHATNVTAQEMRWLQAAWPVLTYARAAGLPMDVIVQPQPTPDAPPLALAFIDGRCKLVLSLRGNPLVQASLERIAPELRELALELMAAHELGHCRRYLDGAWYGLPAGFEPRTPPALPAALQAEYADMQAARREEAYADLVGLAWARERHPQQYARLHAWLMAERGHDRQPGSAHDTLAWTQLAAPGLAAPGLPLFEAAAAWWRAGLAAAD